MIKLTGKIEGLEVTFELTEEDITWDKALQHCINFLRGLGYVIPEDIDVV